MSSSLSTQHVLHSDDLAPIAIHDDDLFEAGCRGWNEVSLNQLSFAPLAQFVLALHCSGHPIDARVLSRDSSAIRPAPLLRVVARPLPCSLDNSACVVLDRRRFRVALQDRN